MKLNMPSKALNRKKLGAFLRPFLAFLKFVCIRKQRGKILKISVNFYFSGVVGSKEYFSHSFWQIFKRGGIGNREKYSRQRAEHRPAGLIVV